MIEDDVRVNAELVGTILITDPKDNDKVYLEIQIFNDATVKSYYGRMTLQEMDAASGIARFVISNIAPVTVALRDCAEKSPFDVERILVGHAKRLCEDVCKQAELGYSYV